MTILLCIIYFIVDIYNDLNDKICLFSYLLFNYLLFTKYKAKMSLDQHKNLV